MSQGDKKKEEKKNTDAWKLKQQEKKRKKEAEQTQQQSQSAKDPNQGEKKQSKKEENKGKKEKNKEKKQEKEEKREQEKKEDKKEEKDEAVAQKSLSALSIEAPNAYKQLLKIEDKTSERQRQIARSYQWQLVCKYLQHYIGKHDVILYIGEKEWNPNCQQVHIHGFNHCSQAELICKYSDITYFLEGSITKLFLEGLFIFANGSLLAKKGTLNLVLLAQYYRIPVVGCGGSWNYNGWAPLGQSALVQHFGQTVLTDYDWIDAKHLKSLVLEVGSINPRQVSTFPPIIYKELNLHSIEW